MNYVDKVVDVYKNIKTLYDNFYNEAPSYYETYDKFTLYKTYNVRYEFTKNESYNYLNLFQILHYSINNNILDTGLHYYESEYFYKIQMYINIKEIKNIKIYYHHKGGNIDEIEATEESIFQFMLLQKESSQLQEYVDILYKIIEIEKTNNNNNIIQFRLDKLFDINEKINYNSIVWN